MPIRPENAARYPADWALRSRFVREVRARNRCEGCGVQNHSVIYPLRCCAEPILDELDRCTSCGKRASHVVLTTAHVYDPRPEAASLLNLAAWCQRCHNRHDMKDRQTRRRQRLEAESGQQRLL